MENSDQSSVLTLPRLRVTRKTLTDPPSWRNSPKHSVMDPEPSGSNLPLMHPDYQSMSEDDFGVEELQGPGARLLSGSLPPNDDSLHTSETSHRLRSILERFDNSIRASGPSSRASMPLTPSEPDSDFDLGPAQSARHSIRSLMEDALKDPGNTPQKLKLMRRASFNASDSPKFDNSIRRSLSDEEREAQLQDTPHVRKHVPFTELSQGEDQKGTSEVMHQEATVARRLPRIPLHSSPVFRQKSHKDLEPFKPVSSESGLSSPEKTQGHGHHSKSHKVISNFNPDNFSLHSNSDMGDASKSQFLSIERNGSRNLLRPISPSISSSSSRTPSPGRGPTKGGSDMWSSLPLASSHASPKSRMLHPTASRNNDLKNVPFDASSSTSDNEERRKDSESGRMRELERNWNRHHPQHAFVRNGGSTSSSITRSPISKDGHQRSHTASPRGEPEFSHKSVSPAATTSSLEEDAHHDHEMKPLLEHGHERPSQTFHEHLSHSAYPSSSFHTPYSHQTPDSMSRRVSSSEAPLVEILPQSLMSSSAAKKDHVEGSRSQRQQEASPPSLSKLTGSKIVHTSSSSRSRLQLDMPNLYDASIPFDSGSQFTKGHRRTITELSELNARSNPAMEPVVVSDSSTEPFEPPHMSTPTSKSPKPHNASPPSDGSFNRITMQADLARLQKAIKPSFTFSRNLLQPPESPANLEPTNETKDVIISDTISMNDAHTPLRPHHDIHLLYPKTPRPPGAFGTPYSQPSKRESGQYIPAEETSPEAHLVYANNSESPQTVNGMDTIATPAPPGGYRMTPGTVKRKGILKVRFDDTKDQAPDDLNDERSNLETINQATDHLTSKSENETLESPARRKGLRLVDEYGRVRKFTEDGTEVPLDRKGSVSQPDAMTESLSGIELINTTEQASVQNAVTNQSESDVADFPLESNNKKVVVSHLTKSLGEMQAVLAREEEALAQSVSTGKATDNGRLNSLTTVSRTARLEREKLTRRLELERDTEGKLQTRVFSARNTTQRGSWWVRRWRLLLLGLILEICFLYLGYRIALIHSKHLWLGTHFDPFYPALYIHKSQAALLKNVGMLPINWSAFSVPGTIEGNVVGFTVKSFGKRLWETALNWKSWPWDNWGDVFTESSTSWPS